MVLKSVHDDGAQESLHGNQPKGDEMSCNIQRFITAVEYVRISPAQDGDCTCQNQQGAGYTIFAM